MNDSIAVLYSGGLDSAILVGWLLAQGRRVQPIYVRCDLHWEEDELRHARTFLEAMPGPSLAPLVVLRQPLADLMPEHWSLTGSGVPNAATPDEAVFLPGRNALLILKPWLWCGQHGIGELALAQLGTNPFSDATPEFYAAFEQALGIAVGGAVAISRPFGQMKKREVMHLGVGLPLELSFSCIDPRGGRHCGRCNKCAERQHAFRDAALADPTPYAA